MVLIFKLESFDRFGYENKMFSFGYINLKKEEGFMIIKVVSKRIFEGMLYNEEREESGIIYKVIEKLNLF